MNIHNFANRQMCEYASIFPTVVSLLDHLLFTIGNGYDVDPDTGMVIDYSGERIDQYPRMTEKRWEKLIKECKDKERRFAIEFRRGKDIDEDYFLKNCEKYYPRNVTDDMFTEGFMYNEILSTAKSMKGSKFGEEFYRPYPLVKEYSKLFSLNQNTPVWFIQISINLCNAWIRFLSEELEIGHVYTGASHDYANAAWTEKHRDMLVEQVKTLQKFAVAA